MTKRALITGATGQDGSYLCELLLEKGYEVYGMKRRTATDGYENIAHLLHDITVVEGELLDQSSLSHIVKQVKPHECYHLAAQSHVGTSFKQPIYTAEATGLGTLRLLETLRELNPSTRFYNAATSELFGSSKPPQNEHTTFHPRSPYGVAKLFGYWTTVNYREAYNMFACNGILFNHEGPRRGESFVTRKITKAAANIKLGLQNELRLGNLQAKRDIGHAKDFVYGMYLMLQQDAPDDYVLATGETHTIEDMLGIVFEHLNLDWHDYVKVDQAFIRPAEVDVLCGDSSKARQKLGWQPKYNWKDLLIDMVESDLRHLTGK